MGAAWGPHTSGEGAPHPRVWPSVGTCHPTPPCVPLQMAVCPRSSRLARWLATSSWALFAPAALLYGLLLAGSWQPDTLALMMPGDLATGLKGALPKPSSSAAQPQRYLGDGTSVRATGRELVCWLWTAARLQVLLCETQVGSHTQSRHGLACAALPAQVSTRSSSPSWMALCSCSAAL
jgi:hypothetical protein